ncbi:helix-turn-helix domain-containing protein [Microbacterium sp. ASV49]|uniref:Helix-turn-helix domain-containing protein n=1 Tax=Microbacterium candidum TaxID=3041922 RepID=A0ABT7MVY8_9MICO|nr:helix-turn-helix domain-containing protein [Microbacterium sp. ASV49]MDL9978625.1 helix-turn-helix domain-containing protein [Microbacterium sp. ASV49]
MPRYTRPANSEYAEDPIKALGNIMQASIIGYLRKNPGRTRAEIADDLEIPKMTVANGLEKLLDAGLIIADPPRDVAVRGQRVRYIVDDKRVTEMVMRLEQVLGEF